MNSNFYQHVPPQGYHYPPPAPQPYNPAFYPPQPPPPQGFPGPAIQQGYGGQPYPFPNGNQMMQHPNMPMQQPARRAWFKITKDEVRNLATDQQTAKISAKSSMGLPSSLSSKSSLTLSRPDGTLLGTIRYHSVSTTDIEFTVNGHSSKMSDSGLMSHKYGFRPSCRAIVTTAAGGEKWYWKMEDAKNGKLKNGKDGAEVLAKLEDGALVFEHPGLSAAECDEILVTGVAVVRKGKKDKEDGEAADAVGEIVGALAG